MCTISLTEFVDFVITLGTPRLTHVKRVKSNHEDGYHPSGDYYRNLRDAIIDLHRTGKPKNHLDSVLDSGLHSSRISNYRQMIRSYKKFIGRKSFQWFEPPSRSTWVHNDLGIRANAELGLVIGGNDTLVKLYFKKLKPSKNQLEIAAQLIYESLPEWDGRIAIIDVRRGKLHSFNQRKSDMLPLIEGEAESFKHIFDAV